MNEADYSRLCVRYGGVVYKGAKQIEENLPRLRGAVMEIARRDCEVLRKGSRVYQIAEYEILEIWYKGRRSHKMTKKEIESSGEYKWGRWGMDQRVWPPFH